MAAISQFSTAENFSRLTAALDKVNKAINESEIAQQAGIPTADIMLATAKATKEKIQRLLNTYFPGGVKPAGS